MASASSPTAETWIGLPSAKAPWPRAADQRPVALKGDQRGPDGNPPHEVLRAVDRVEDPPPTGLAGRLPELLAEDAVARPGRRDPLAQGFLRGPVGVGDRGQ